MILVMEELEKEAALAIIHSQTSFSTFLTALLVWARQNINWPIAVGLSSLKYLAMSS